MDAAVRFVRAINDEIINPILGLIFVSALFLFLWGGMRYMRAEAGTNDRIQGRQHMIWGIIAMVAMVSVYSIFAILLRTAGVDSSQLGPVGGSIPL